MSFIRSIRPLLLVGSLSAMVLYCGQKHSDAPGAATGTTTTAAAKTGGIYDIANAVKVALMGEGLSEAKAASVVGAGLAGSEAIALHGFSLSGAAADTAAVDSFLNGIAKPEALSALDDAEKSKVLNVGVEATFENFAAQLPADDVASKVSERVAVFSKRVLELHPDSELAAASTEHVFKNMKKLSDLVPEAKRNEFFAEVASQSLEKMAQASVPPAVRQAFLQNKTAGFVSALTESAMKVAPDAPVAGQADLLGDLSEKFMTAGAAAFKAVDLGAGLAAEAITGGAFKTIAASRAGAASGSMQALVDEARMKRMVDKFTGAADTLVAAGTVDASITSDMFKGLASATIANGGDAAGAIASLTQDRFAAQMLAAPSLSGTLAAANAQFAATAAAIGSTVALDVAAKGQAAVVGAIALSPNLSEANKLVFNTSLNEKAASVVGAGLGSSSEVYQKYMQAAQKEQAAMTAALEQANKISATLSASFVETASTGSVQGLKAQFGSSGDYVVQMASKIAASATEGQLTKFVGDSAMAQAVQDRAAANIAKMQTEMAKAIPGQSTEAAAAFASAIAGGAAAMNSAASTAIGNVYAAPPAGVTVAAGAAAAAQSAFQATANTAVAQAQMAAVGNNPQELLDLAKKVGGSEIRQMFFTQNGASLSSLSASERQTKLAAIQSEIAAKVLANFNIPSASASQVTSHLASVVSTFASELATNYPPGGSALPPGQFASTAPAGGGLGGGAPAGSMTAPAMGLK